MLLKAVSLVEAWLEGSDDSMEWMRGEWPPNWDPEDVKVFANFFRELLHSVGALGVSYAPVLYFAGSSPAIRWPESRGGLRWRLTRLQVESNPELFQEDSCGLVFSKSKETRSFTAEEVFLATANDKRSDAPHTEHIKLALNQAMVPTSLRKAEPIPPALKSLFPEDELMVLPCYVEMTQSELARSPFRLRPSDFRKGTSVALHEATFNLARARLEALGIEIPEEARELSPEEVRDQVWAREGRNLVEKFQNVPLQHLAVRQEMLKTVSSRGGFSREQWELLEELSDAATPEEGAQAIKEIPELPRPTTTIWSLMLDEALRLPRDDQLLLVRCEYPNCWQRFSLSDRRFRHCEKHRRSQAEHRESSTARRARRVEERSRIGSASQRAKWAKQKREERARKKAKDGD